MKSGIRWWMRQLSVSKNTGILRFIFLFGILFVACSGFWGSVNFVISSIFFFFGLFWILASVGEFLSAYLKMTALTPMYKVSNFWFGVILLALGIRVMLLISTDWETAYQEFLEEQKVEEEAKEETESNRVD